MSRSDHLDIGAGFMQCAKQNSSSRRVECRFRLFESNQIYRLAWPPLKESDKYGQRSQRAVGHLRRSEIGIACPKPKRECTVSIYLLCIDGVDGRIDRTKVLTHS